MLFILLLLHFQHRHLFAKNTYNTRHKFYSFCDRTDHWVS